MQDGLALTFVKSIVYYILCFSCWGETILGKMTVANNEFVTQKRYVMLSLASEYANNHLNILTFVNILSPVKRL